MKRIFAFVAALAVSIASFAQGFSSKQLLTWSSQIEATEEADV